MNIADLSDFDHNARSQTLLFLVWESREFLSDAERGDVLSGQISACEDAKRLLDAASTVLNLNARTERAHDLLKRASSAAGAAAEQGAIASSYALASVSPTASDWEKQYATKATAIFKRAAETARRESHRALAELCELFPNAIPKE